MPAQSCIQPASILAQASGSVAHDQKAVTWYCHMCCIWTAWGLLEVHLTGITMIAEPAVPAKASTPLPQLGASDECPEGLVAALNHALRIKEDTVGIAVPQVRVCRDACRDPKFKCVDDGVAAAAAARLWHFQGSLHCIQSVWVQACTQLFSPQFALCPALHASAGSLMLHFYAEAKPWLQLTVTFTNIAFSPRASQMHIAMQCASALSHDRAGLHCNSFAQCHDWDCSLARDPWRHMHKGARRLQCRQQRSACT